MSRKPRFNLIGLPQHVIQRGNNREPYFYAEADYCRYLHYLKEAVDKKPMCCSCICINDKSCAFASDTI